MDPSLFYVLQISFPLYNLSFTVLIVSFSKQRILILMYSNLFFFTIINFCAVPQSYEHIILYQLLEVIEFFIIYI